MAASLAGQLVVAISSRALFDFEEENEHFEANDDRAYMALQLERIDAAAKPGVAFSLVQKLLAFNDATAQRVEVVILSRNDPVSGMRVFRSAQAYGMPIQRGVFTRGGSPWRYLKPLAANLFLSANEADVRSALEAGVPAARVYPHSARASDAHPEGSAHRLRRRRRAVLRRGRARVPGQAASTPSRRTSASRPRRRSPPGRSSRCCWRCTGCRTSRPHGMRIRTALVTARSAPAHERAIRTLMEWNVEIDEAMFLGGLHKGEFLREFEPDFFFDDQTGHIENASAHVPSGHVASGISNPRRR